MALAGKGGYVMIGADRIAEISNWNLDLGADDIEITSFDSDGWKEYLAGLKEWSGSIEGNFDAGDTDGQRAILNAWLAGNTLAMVFHVTSSISFSGDVLVTPSLDTPVDDKVGFSSDLQGTGPLSIN